MLFISVWIGKFLGFGENFRSRNNGKMKCALSVEVFKAMNFIALFHLVQNKTLGFRMSLDILRAILIYSSPVVFHC